MENFNPLIVFLFIALLFLPGCDIISAIFQAGFWTAIVLIVIVIALIVWGISSFRKNDHEKRDV